MISRLRNLRDQVRAQRQSVVADLREFFVADNMTFRRLPTSKVDPDDPSITTTCSGLMGLVLNQQIDKIYADDQKASKKEKEESVRNNLLSNTLPALFNHKWASSGLEECNPFTVCMVFRTMAVLAQSKYVPEQEILRMNKLFYDLSTDKVKRKTNLTKLMQQIVSDLPAELIVRARDTGSGKVKVKGKGKAGGATFEYPPSPTLAYWLLDGISRFRGVKSVTIPKLDVAKWATFTTWLFGEFSILQSLVASESDIMQDPVQLAMSACAIQKLAHLEDDHSDFREARDYAREMRQFQRPSENELRHAIECLFKVQGKSGVWPKYFPLFHYPDAGINFCFTFELLEGVLNEFPDMLEQDSVLAGIERSVHWCTENRLSYRDTHGKKFTGWNSGGQLESLRNSMPESWATSVVHMFFHTLDQASSRVIDRLLRNRWSKVLASTPNKNALSENLVDSDVTVEGSSKSVINLLTKYFLDGHVPEARSALLFGPPGTSKTTVVKNIAVGRGWPFVELDPSNFLSDGLDRIYIMANKIFDDLMDLKQTVILFDEMDGLVRSRDAKLLAPMSEFMTTCMLPKLAKLHETNNLFFMATNYPGRFDRAIKRQGRFDLLLCLGPSQWRHKVDSLRKFFSDVAQDDLDKLRDTLKSILMKKNALRKALDYFSYGEFKEFLRPYKKSGTFDDFIATVSVSPGDFYDRISEWFDSRIHLRKDSKAFKRFASEQMQSKIQL